MAVMDFPSSPTNGQTYGQYTFDSSKGAWRVSANTASAVVTSATAPSSPVAGNLWYNTTDGSTYVYFNDGDTSQWVELRSEVATSQVGLVPVVPTSVTVGSGTGTVAIDGAVTFSGATYINLSNVFTSAFRNYRVLVKATNSADSDWQFRLANSGSPSSTAYYHAGLRSDSANGATSSRGGANATSLSGIYGTSADNGTVAMDIFEPAVASKSTFIYTMQSYSTNFLTFSMSGTHNVASAYADLYISMQTGTFTGTLKVYGYR